MKNFNYTPSLTITLRIERKQKSIFSETNEIEVINSGTAFYTGTLQCLTLFGNHHRTKLTNLPPSAELLTLRTLDLNKVFK